MSRDEWERAYTSGQHAQQWDTPWSSPELAGFLAGSATIPQRAIDLGCGTGADAVFLAQQGIEVIGLDISPTALDLGRQRAAKSGVEVEWVEGSVLDLPLPDAHVDLAIDRGCLHHVPHDEQPAYAREAARVLRPGGVLLVREMNQPGHHKHFVTEGTLRAMIVDAPLRIRSVVEVDMVGAHRSARATLAVLDRD